MELSKHEPVNDVSAAQAHERPLLRYVSHLIGSTEPARDIVQEAFVRLCSQTKSVAIPEWLFVVCRNLAIDRLRKEHAMTAITEDQLFAQSNAAMRLAAQDESEHALRLLATLPPRQQEAIRLKFQNDLSYQQIAQVMDTTANNVGVLIHAGLKTLREKMQ